MASKLGTWIEMTTTATPTVTSTGRDPRGEWAHEIRSSRLHALIGSRTSFMVTYRRGRRSVEKVDLIQSFQVASGEPS
jgi:hypothetical protein